MNSTTNAYQANRGRLPSTAEILALDANDSEKLHLINLKRVCLAVLMAQIVIIVAMATIVFSVADNGSLPIESKDAYLLGFVMGSLPMASLLLSIISFHYASKLKAEMREILFREPD